MSESLMALNHLSYNQEYLKHKEVLDYWNAWVLKNIHFPKSPSKLALKGKERNRNIDLLLCPVCARHVTGASFVFLFYLISTTIVGYTELQKGKLRLKDSEEPQITQSISGTLGPGTSFQIHEVYIISYLPSACRYSSIKISDSLQSSKYDARSWTQSCEWGLGLLSLTFVCARWHTLNLTVMQQEPSVWEYREGAKPQVRRSTLRDREKYCPLDPGCILLLH